MELNTRVEQIMKYAELTPSEFANKVGVNPSNISQIINRRNKPSLDLIKKIKNQFPELQWDWLIEGKGTMTTDTLSSPTPLPNIVESKFNFDDEFIPIPNLFDNEVSDRENLSNTFSEEDLSLNIENPNPRESNNQPQDTEQEKISDSQRLENEENLIPAQNIDNQGNKIKKIVFFYENGKFEVFEP